MMFLEYVPLKARLAFLRKSAISINKLVISKLVAENFVVIFVRGSPRILADLILC